MQDAQFGMHRDYLRLAGCHVMSVGGGHRHELVQAEDTAGRLFALGIIFGKRFQHGDVVYSRIEEDILHAIGVHDIDKRVDIAVLFHGIRSSILDYLSADT